MLTVLALLGSIGGLSLGLAAARRRGRSRFWCVPGFLFPATLLILLLLDKRPDARESKATRVVEMAFTAFMVLCLFLSLVVTPAVNAVTASHAVDHSVRVPGHESLGAQ
jgi:drug/metabolite transporter (DMT)-like permease